jgi:hypothetical protein
LSGSLVGSGVGDLLVAVDAAGIVLGDGGVEIDISNAAALQLDTAPSAGAAARLSLFQPNVVALKITRWMNWAKRADAVAFRRVSLGGSPA